MRKPYLILWLGLHKLNAKCDKYDLINTNRNLKKKDNILREQRNTNLYDNYI